MSGMWNLRSLLKRHPFVTNSAIYGTLYVGAEWSQQLLTKPKKKLNNDDGAENALSNSLSSTQNVDYAAVGRYAVMGTFVYAPTLYVWYKWLDSKYVGTAKTIILKKIVLDQFLLTPYLLVVFFTGMSIMEKSEEPFKELKEKFLSTFQQSCAFWLPVQTLNFALVPPRFRVIFMGVSGFIWINILCLIKRQHKTYGDENQHVFTESNVHHDK